MPASPSQLRDEQESESHSAVTFPASRLSSNDDLPKINDGDKFEDDNDKTDNGDSSDTRSISHAKIDVQNSSTRNSDSSNLPLKENGRDENDWYTIFLDVEKSKFFDPQYAVLEGDVWRDVYIERTKQFEPSSQNNHINNKNPESTSSNNDDDIDDNDHGTSVPRVMSRTMILKRNERCFVIVRRETTTLLFDTLVHSTMAEIRRKIKPRTTGWLRHELYGLKAGIRLPLGSALATNSLTINNKRGIKCLDLPGEFIGLFDEETLEQLEETTTERTIAGNKEDQESRHLGGGLTRIMTCPTPHYSADNDDILTIQQSDLQERMTRHKHFAKWLVNTFGTTMLNQGTILDVAGGNGKLSSALLKMGIQSCTIVDPQPLCPERKDDGLTIIRKPLIGDGTTLSTNDDGDSDIALEELIRQCSIIVGLHPDEATEAIMDMAMRLGKPFAISPCCVMSRLFPNRRGRMGEPVRTVHQLCRFLMDKQPEMKVDYLPFMGRNKVLYWKGPESIDPTIMCQPVGTSPSAIHYVFPEKDK